MVPADQRARSYRRRLSGAAHPRRGADGVAYYVGDEDEFAEAMATAWLSQREVDGARAGLTELIDIIERKQLIAFLSELQPFRSTQAPLANPMRRVPASSFPLI